MRTVLRLLACVLVLLTVSCAGMSKEDVGRIFGGVGGAVVGDQLGGTLGAVIGGIAGYVVGGSVGAHMDRHDQDRAARNLERELGSSQYRRPNDPHRDSWHRYDREYEIYTHTRPTPRAECRAYTQDMYVTISGRRTLSRKDGIACWDASARIWRVAE